MLNSGDNKLRGVRIELIDYRSSNKYIIVVLSAEIQRRYVPRGSNTYIKYVHRTANYLFDYR